MRIAPNESLYCSNFFVFLLDIRSELPFNCTNVLGCFAPRRVPIASRHPRLSCSTAGGPYVLLSLLGSVVVAAQQAVVGVSQKGTQNLCKPRGY
jgi:hypothetical protein